MIPQTRTFLIAWCSLLLATGVQAQFDLKATNSNWLYMGTSGNPTVKFPVGSNNGVLPVTNNSMFRGLGPVAGASGPIKQTGTIPSTYSSQYPANTAKTIVAARMTFGNAFASGVPRFGLGDVISPPLTKADGLTAAPSGYWRQMPVAPGESISNRVVAGTVIVTASSTTTTSVTVSSVPSDMVTGSTLLGKTISAISGTTITLSGNANAAVSSATSVPFVSPSATVVPVAAIAVSVRSSSRTSKVVTVDSVPTSLVVGTILLGESVVKIEDTAITLADNANRTINASTSVSALPIPNYYYSKHAEKVFASQAGLAKVTWITTAVTENGGYEIYNESFSVSSNTSKTLRTIYWTEGMFDGPPIAVSGSVQTVNPIYNTTVPKAVADEVSVPGYTPLTENLSTLSYTNYGGKGSIHAYNVEGRILVEYLGGIRGTGGVYEYLGMEVVDLVRAPSINYLSVNLGKKILPHNNDTALVAYPTLSSQQNSEYYATAAGTNGGLDYYAEQETSKPNAPDDGSPASGGSSYEKVCFYWLEKGSFGMLWPKFQDRYWLRWSGDLNDYAHYMVDPGGSTSSTGISFSAGGISPAIIAQDSTETQAQIDVNTQNFFVSLSNGDTVNRSMLKFTNSQAVWYQPIYTQTESRNQSMAVTCNGTATITVSTTSVLEVGMVVSGTGSSSAVKIVSIPDATHVVLSQTVSTSGNFTFTVQSDTLAPINSTVYVGDRLVPPAGHENAGYISSGTCYYPDGYINPFVSGVAEANKGAIIPVNAVPSKNQLTVRWFKKVSAPQSSFSDFYIAGKLGTYTVTYPTAPSQIVIAQGIGTGDLNPDEAAGSVYYQNSPTLVGYNPNEEHAFLIGGRAYALRDDLNVYPSVSGYSAANYTSDPYVLLAYQNSSDGRPAMHAYQVLRKNATYDFNYTATAGTLLVKPYPLPLMPEPLVANTASPATPAMVSKDKEIEGADVPANTSTSVRDSLAYKKFTFEDRKGFNWVHRGPHDVAKVVSTTPNGTANVTLTSTTGLSAGMVVSGTGITGTVTIVTVTDATRLVLSSTVASGVARSLTYSPAFTMKLYYLSRDGFYIPGATSQPATGTVLPFLRNSSRSGQALNTAASSVAVGATDEPLSIVYQPAWPTDAPQLMVGETLALPKFGLPQVRGQSSALVYYQQSIAKDSTANDLSKPSVSLHDLTREKTVAIDASGVALTALPTSILTTVQSGKTYFQGLPPHLQKRFYFDPMRGSKGTLVFKGEFHDEAAGDDYYDLNLLSSSDASLLKGLASATDAKKTSWDKAINLLKTTMQTFIEDPSKKGAYKVDSEWDVFAVASNASATAVIPGSTSNYLHRLIAEAFSWTIPKTTANGPTLATVGNSDTAVDSYAITATGKGTGYVTMVFGNGSAFTPVGDPVQVKVFKVAPQLYTGDLKVITSSNPLDEQVTLRHSADFAGKPEEYEFDWRWSTGAASAPSTYSYTITSKVGDAATSTNGWYKVTDPGAFLPTDAQYASANTTLTCPRNEVVRPLSYNDDEVAAGYPSMVFKSTTGGNFTSGVPGSIYFSANLGDYDGLVLYVNGQAALAYNAPSPQFTSVNAASGLTENGLSKQFNVDPRYFTAGVNRIEVAIYSNADVGASSSLNFKLEAMVETDLVTTGTTWQTPTSGDNNMAIVGGKSTNPFGGPQFVLNDRWFTVRYRPLSTSGNVLGSTNWSRWTPPQFTEGWIKRVLAAINPYEQRVKDLYNNQINTNVSVITQAGTRWEGDVALTMDNINSTGLISIYETVLNRAKSMSIDANTNDPDTNNALLLAAGYLNDLYTILGNEAYADAANPTISINDSSTATEVNTSRFSFEGQVSSSLDEELALLRGRDDSVSPGVRTAPAYNRLYWNYTHGINSGEAIYATNYNIKEKTGSSTANGVIDEADAQNMFPQGHGDAYGHYLTALKGYYRLLRNSNFTWTPRGEAVTILGQPVTVDFQDERKFAAAANNVARTSQQVCALTYRKNYKDDAAGGWLQFRDSTPMNADTGLTSHRGLDEEVSRGAQGSLFNWAMSNALVPDVDTYHSGVQKIDRTTVPEISELAMSIDTFQTTIDNANARLNPLGLSPGSISFDIDPYFASSLGQELSRYQGQSQFLQLYDRSLKALNNAAGSFNQAATMSRSLRNQEDQVNDYTSSIAEQETAYRDQLIELFGRPYEGDVGPGKTFDTTYYGPDLEHWFVVDRPFASTPLVMVDTSNPVGSTYSIRVRTSLCRTDFTNKTIQDIVNEKNNQTQMVSVTVTPNQFVQYSDKFMTNMGKRPETGELQDALMEAHLAYLDYNAALKSSIGLETNFTRKANALLEKISIETTKRNMTIANSVQKLVTTAIKSAAEYAKEVVDEAKPKVNQTADAIAEFFPRMVGVANDVTSGARGAVKTTATVSQAMLSLSALASKNIWRVADYAFLVKDTAYELAMADLQRDLDIQQEVYEFEKDFKELTGQVAALQEPSIRMQQANERVANVLARANRILTERETFRMRAGALIQGYRTKDVTFRLFRNEALEQYRSLFDLASRYTYLAAKSYDFETGLLGTTTGQKVFDRIVASRSLGDLTGGVPQSSVSTLGDAGLAGTMAQLNSDFSVAEGRLGINNPDYYGTVFSLRQELFRILDDPDETSDDDAWKQTLEQHIVSNVMDDADVAVNCRNIQKSNGTAVPGIIIPFSSTIEHGKNFFGLDLAAFDHAFSASSYATKISNAGVVFPGYQGMDASIADPNITAIDRTTALSATPYVYLIPCGNDIMRAPPFGDTGEVRTWSIVDQALPLPYNLGANDFNSNQFFNANGTLNEQPWVIRKHQAFRAVGNVGLFQGGAPPLEFSSNRLIARSAWNSRWKLVIPAYTFSASEQDGLNRFVSSVTDIGIYLRTYSHSGN
ncbi:MAG: hypothetical protein ORN51_00130 [Akkermansiaceae bacterium]|nr:hypothetical protein [Akkermansiaceae bacterium]